MFDYLRNIKSLRDVAVKHIPDEIDTIVADGVRYPKVAVHYFVDAVERVLLVDDRVEEDAQSPNVLLFSSVWLACQYLRGGII